MTTVEENQSPDAPYGYTIDAKTGQLRPKKSPACRGCMSWPTMPTRPRTGRPR